MGWRYVIERSTLRHDRVRRRQSVKTANGIVESAHEGFQRLLEWFRVGRATSHQRSTG